MPRNSPVVTIGPARLALVSVEALQSALVRLAPLRLAWVSVESSQLARVRFCPLKSRAGQAVAPQTDALQVLRLVTGGGRQAGRG